MENGIALFGVELYLMAFLDVGQRCEELAFGKGLRAFPEKLFDLVGRFHLRLVEEKRKQHIIFRGEKSVADTFVDSPFDFRFVDGEKLCRTAGKFFSRKITMAGRAASIIEDKPDAGFETVHAFRLDADALSDRIGNLKADALDVLDQLVRVVLHDARGSFAVRLENPDSLACADVV